MNEELEFLESLFRDDDKGNELQFFKDSVLETKIKMNQRIMELREDANSGGKDEN